MFKNLTRKADKLGNINFISFLGAVLSRLAYMNDNKFLKSYNKIMGQIIPTEILTSINNEVSNNNMFSLSTDAPIINYLKSNGAGNKITTIDYIDKNKQTKQSIDFFKMSELVNISNGDTKPSKNEPQISNSMIDGSNVKYISIGWSNYGEIYVVADKRMPNIIFVIFRGTYSAKTAASYSKPTSIIPLTACEHNGIKEQFLYGIYKITVELIHTIVESIKYLSENFLDPNVKKTIFTTGHSLGGAMSTIFAYVWMGIKTTTPYNEYNINESIICISLGAPRCLSSESAKRFCENISSKKILYYRITSRGDPVTALPPKMGFQHPCSEDGNMREQVVEDCNSLLTMRPLPNISYSSDLDCQNYKTRTYAPNPLSHTVYLNIIYTNAVDIAKFMKGIGVSMEVFRDSNKSTHCRLIMGHGEEYKVVFFNVDEARLGKSNIDAELDDINQSQKGGRVLNIEPNDNQIIKIDVNKEKNSQVVQPETLKVVQPETLKVVQQETPQVIQPETPKVVQPETPQVVQPTTPQVVQQSQAVSTTQMTIPKKTEIFKIGGKVSEDVKMTSDSFKKLIEGMSMIPSGGDLCPINPSQLNIQVVHPFNDNLMGELGCPAKNIMSGGKNNKKIRKTKKIKKNKIKRNKITRRINKYKKMSKKRKYAKMNKTLKH